MLSQRNLVAVFRLRTAVCKNTVGFFAGCWLQGLNRTATFPNRAGQPNFGRRPPGFKTLIAGGLA